MKSGLGWLKLPAGVAAGFMAGLLTTLMPSVTAAPDQLTSAQLELAGETVRLGVAKTPLITRLAKDFVLENSGKRVSGAEFWFVSRRGDVSTNVGSLQFKNDVLVAATREWSSFEPDARAAAFLKAMYGAVERVFGKGKSGTVRCTLVREPTNEHLQIDLASRGHSVSIVIAESASTGGARYMTGIVEENIAK